MTTDSEVERLRLELERLAPSRGTPDSGADRFAELLGMFLANVPDFILLVATDGNILFLNRARPGKTVAEVVGRNLFEYTPDERLREATERVLATGEAVSLESTAMYTDGSVHEFLTRISPVFNADRSIVALALIATDMSAQKRAEAALRDSQDRLKITVEATGMGLWSWDIKRDLVTWDDALCRILGVTQETAPRSRESYLDRTHPEDRERLREAIVSTLQTGVYSDAEHRIVRPDGTTRRIMAKGSVTRAPDGSLERIVGGSLDVTEQRELEERSRQTQKLEALGQLSAGVAHNFNNMLMAILPNIEMALESAVPDAVPLLRSAQEAAQRAAKLVRQLMTFAGRARPTDKRAEDVRELVERSVAICQRAFDRSIELSSRCPAQAQPVLMDAAQLEQALLNLLFNARDAVLGERIAKKRVSVSVERLTGQAEVASLGLAPGRAYVCVRVNDNGVGMDAGVRRRIYEPFFTTKDIGRGTGLGLSTARAIVQEHAGVLDCTTSEGRGSTFSIYLPLAPVLSQPSREALEAAQRSDSKTILVVDDEAPVREVTRAMLERAGYTVYVASGGREALELLSQGDLLQHVSLVLLDLSMPGMSGDAVRRELRRLAPRLTVAYFSGYAIDAADDVAGIIEKPATYADLIRSVREILERAGQGTGAGSDQ